MTLAEKTWTHDEVRDISFILATSKDKPTALPSKDAQHLAHLVEELYLIYHDGRLITHLQAKESEMDSDLMSGMLTAIMDFVKDSFQKEGYLGAIDYGDSKILLENGKYCYLAVVIYGDYDDDLRSRLESTLRTIEVSLTGVLEEWNGDKAVLASAQDALRPILLSTASITREMIDTQKQGQDVKLISAWEFFQGYVKLKIAADNRTSTVVTDVRINLNYDDNVLRLDRLEPEYQHRGNEINVGNLDGRSRKTVALFLDPLICLKSVVNASMNFKTFRGEFNTVAMKPRSVEVVCPIFFTPENANTAMLRRLVTEELECQDVKLFEVPQGLPIMEAFQAAQSVMSGRDVQQVRQYRKQDPLEAEAWYFGLTKVKKRQMVVRISVLSDVNVIEIFASASDPASLTGLLAELGSDLQGQLKKMGRPIQQITNVTIKDSIINRSTLLFSGEGEDIVIEDSAVNRSDIIEEAKDDHDGRDG